MNGSSSKSSTNVNGGRYMWLGFAMGLACMAGLFIAGAVKGNAGMMVMASSAGVLLGAVWSSTTFVLRKKAA